jgi:hypothetical protein
MLTRRVHLLLDDERYERVATAARIRKVSVAEVVREAIDVALPPRWPDRVAAASAILAAEPMDVPDSVAELKAEIEAAHRRPA